jgi:hypothetical protein
MPPPHPAAVIAHFPQVFHRVEALDFMSLRAGTATVCGHLMVRDRVAELRKYQSHDDQYLRNCVPIFDLAGRTHAR